MEAPSQPAGSRELAQPGGHASWRGELSSGALAGVARGAVAETFFVQNTLLASDAGGNCAQGQSLTDGGHNLSFGDSTCPSTFASGDPELGPLADNGGPTQTISLNAGAA